MIARSVAQAMAGVMPAMMAQIQEGSSAAATAMMTQIQAGSAAAAAAAATAATAAANNHHPQGQAGDNTDRHYKSFTNAKPPSYGGSEGAAGLLQWFEKLESTFEMCGCPEGLKVRFASGMFAKRALTWWNNQIKAQTREVLQAQPWAVFKESVTEEFVPEAERQKLEYEFWTLQLKGSDYAKYTERFHELALLVPHLVTPESRALSMYARGLPESVRAVVIGSSHTLQAAIHLTARLIEDAIRAGSMISATPETTSSKDTRASKKRKATNYAATVPAGAPIPAPAQPIPQNLHARNPPPVAQVRRGYTGPHPQCNTCRYHHPAQAPCYRCDNCQRIGHLARNCRSPPAVAAPHAQAPAANNPRGCHHCGVLGHFRNQCPQLVANIPAARGRAYVMGAAENDQALEIVEGTFLSNTSFVSVLLCTSADANLASYELHID